MNFNKFEHRLPSPQCALDIFKGHWASDVGLVIPNVVSGDAGMFVDGRINFVIDRLGVGDGTLKDMSILELGPLEGAHTYLMEKAGAQVLAIEANVEAYLKCLIVKELTRLKNSRFELGDFNLFLDNTSQRFDVVVACGVLYHMPDPLRTLSAISRLTDRCFLWTHYYDALNYPGLERTPRMVSHGGASATYWDLDYPDMGIEKFWGGNKPVAAWMTKDDILAALKVFGYNHFEVVQDHPNHQNGACMSVVVKR